MTKFKNPRPRVRVSTLVPTYSERVHKAAQETGLRPEWVADHFRLEEEAPELARKTRQGSLDVDEAIEILDQRAAAEAAERANSDSTTIWELRRLWKKATETEKARFRKWVKGVRE